jgi:hypothetical protein
VNRQEAVAIVVLAILVAWGLMYLGWKRREERQSGIAPLPAVPPGVAEQARAAGVEGSYVSTTTAHDLLDRVTAHGLGAGGVAHVVVADGGSGDDAGVMVARSGAPDVFIPASALADVRVESMRAGKAAPHGLVVIEWRLGELAVATAFRPRDPRDREALLRSVQALISRQDAA